MTEELTIEKKIQNELKVFELQERFDRGLLDNNISHWKKPNEGGFYSKERGFTTILVGGLTLAHDYMVEGALKGLGYNIKCLDCPDNESLRYGKEYGNRGQCNPTYYTVGNLVKHLTHLRDNEGLSLEEINKNYIFLTAGACGPCRFGMYEAEYRKALADAGFENFRVLTFEQKVDVQDAKELGLQINLKFILALVKAFMAGDLINALGYRIRPYEINKGETDKVIEECKDILYHSFLNRKSLTFALWKVRKNISKIKTNFLQPKPIVDIIGEFWAMTTEGDGNYKLQRWLEQEGAEVHVQQVTYWLKYILWESEKWYLDRINLKSHDEKGLKGKNAKSSLRYIKLGRALLKAHYYFYSWVVGYKNAKLPDMKEIADYANEYYSTNLSGGEGHMEVGKLISAAKHMKSHMVLSVKPFGCMPSSSVSDGVQSKIQELFPDVIFYPIETSGDGAVNVYSRVQMMLYKAKQKVKDEYQSVLNELNTTNDLLQKNLMNKSQFRNALYKAPAKKTSTASNIAYKLFR